MKFLARTNYMPLNESLFNINLRESYKCNICDDDMIEDMHHFLFECKTYDVSDKNCSRKLKH